MEAPNAGSVDHMKSIADTLMMLSGPWLSPMPRPGGSFRTWYGVSGFGRIRYRVGFGRIRADSEETFAVLYNLYGHFDPTETDSRFGLIR